MTAEANLQTKTCNVNGCDGVVRARGYCPAHYEQVRAHGRIVNEVVEKQTGRGKHPLFVTWRNMIARCYDVNTPFYKNYGGRGIKMCERWLIKGGVGFANFVADMGEKPTQKHTLDRTNNDGDYTPENCRWATRVEQIHNRMARV